MRMAENWIEIAQKMAEAARAGVIIERKQLEQRCAETKVRSTSSKVPASSR